MIKVRFIRQGNSFHLNKKLKGMFTREFASIDDLANFINKSFETHNRRYHKRVKQYSNSSYLFYANIDYGIRCVNLKEDLTPNQFHALNEKLKVI